MSVSFPNFQARNLLTPRMAFARLRTPPYNDWQNSPHARSAAQYSPQTAVEDKALCLLSEAAEEFLRRLLTGAVRSAHADLDGVRLFEAQRTAGAHHHLAKPPLGMVLGCDLEKQVAKAQHKVGGEVRSQEKHLNGKIGQANAGVVNQITGVEAKHLDSVPSMVRESEAGSHERDPGVNNERMRTTITQPSHQLPPILCSLRWLTFFTLARSPRSPSGRTCRPCRRTPRRRCSRWRPS